MIFEHRSRREFLQMLPVVAAPVLGGLPLWLRYRRDEKTDIPFDEEMLQEARNSKAEVMVIGNSMVFARLSPRHLRKIAKPLHTHDISVGGTRTLHWYLYLKNVAAVCQPPPRLAFVFYRDYDFTNVGLHIEGKHLDFIRAAMRPGDEPLLALARGETSAEGWRQFVASNFAADAANKSVREKLSDTAYDTAALGGSDDALVEKHVERIFDLDRLRPEIPDAGALESDNIDVNIARFTADPDRNLMTRFIAVTRERKIQLCFYRVKRRPNAEGIREQDDVLRAYTAQLQRFVESEGCLFMDETEDPRITLDLFSNRDHLKEEARPQYTEWFLERVRSILPAPFTMEEFQAARKHQGN